MCRTFIIVVVVVVVVIVVLRLLKIPLGAEQNERRVGIRGRIRRRT